MRDPRRRPRVRRRKSARDDPLRRQRACRTPRKDAPPQTILGAEQKAWFKERLRSSSATWKIWGNSQGARSTGAPTRRTCPPGSTQALAGRRLRQHAAAATTAPPTSSAARSTTSCATRGITGFAIVSGDRHSFWAGLRGQGTSAAGRSSRSASASSRGSISAPGRDGGARAPPAQGPSAAPAVPRGPARRRKPRVDVQHAAAGTASAPASSTRRAATSPRRARSRTRRSRRTSSSSTWADTAMRRCGCPRDEMRTEFVCIPRPIDAQRAPRRRTAALSRASTARRCGAPASGPGSGSEVLEGDPGLSI